MRLVPLVVSMAALALAVSPGEAEAPRPDDVWSSGLQMGQAWAGARAASGDVATFFCTAKNLPHVKKGVAFRVEFAAIGQLGLTRGQSVEIEARVDGGAAVRLPLEAEGGPAASLGGGEAARRDLARLIAAVARGQALTLGIGRETVRFGPGGAPEAFADVAGCARATDGRG